MQMEAGGKIKSLMSATTETTCLVITYQKNMKLGEGGCMRRDKLAALEIDSRCLHVVYFAYYNVPARREGV